VLDPNALTLGLARRFTGYKRPNLLLDDVARLALLLNDSDRPVQLILAGKAHPADEDGKKMIREWIDLAQRPEFRQRVVFLEDYGHRARPRAGAGRRCLDQHPRRPWEACGTSGVKVLVNGGLNLSERYGWWEEAYAPELGWAIGDGREHPEGERDREDAKALSSSKRSRRAPARRTDHRRGELPYLHWVGPGHPTGPGLHGSRHSLPARGAYSGRASAYSVAKMNCGLRNRDFIGARQSIDPYMSNGMQSGPRIGMQKGPLTGIGTGLSR
jgi:hypothetical protein